MTGKLRALFPSFISSVLNSYTQVFFSNDRIFAVILVIVSFFDLFAGLSGLIAVILSNVAAYLIGFNRTNIKAGYYGFNSLLVGLGLGIFYQPAPEFFIVVLFAALMTLFLTVMMEGVIGKYGLPFLSISFLLAIWMVTLASRQFTTLTVSERGIYMMNEMYGKGGLHLVGVYDWFGSIDIPDPLKTYFKSLGAILFQYHLLPGIILAAGLLIYSRIAFLLSLLGFFSAYFYYHFIGANFLDLNYGFIGFNFILTSIAIGGFFIIPSKHSFLWVLLLTPLISIILASTNTLFSVFQLSIFSLPFNIVVLLFIYVLKFRERFYKSPEMVVFQQYSPEKNLYSHHNYRDRFGKAGYFSLALPFIGEWKITQGHNGEITHKEEWRHAWDFEISDEENKVFKGDNLKKENYYCFNKPVIAPADGWIEEVVGDIEDNEIGQVNLEQNWGNSVVIRHADQFYTKLSHLRKDSINVTPGAHVKKGDLVAACGNSGRSPVPHLHFQVQSTPFIGSKTLDYPLSHYILDDGGKFALRSWDRPEKNATVSNILKNQTLEKAFHFIPGEKLSFSVMTGKGRSQTVNWEVQAGFSGSTFIYCEDSGSKAYFRYDGDIHYFTHFEGDKKSLLFLFYLGAFKVLTGYYQDLRITDSYPLNALNHRGIILLQDFVAPFFLFMRPSYTMDYVKLKDDFTQVKILLSSNTRVRIGNRVTRSLDFEFEIDRNGIERFSINEKNRRITATRL
jgi:urea transporter/murein DD-endopeptidase MepM/ murein hydrolase activator NlpD